MVILRTVSFMIALLLSNQAISSLICDFKVDDLSWGADITSDDGDLLGATLSFEFLDSTDFSNVLITDVLSASISGDGYADTFLTSDSDVFGSGLTELFTSLSGSPILNLGNNPASTNTIFLQFLRASDGGLFQVGQSTPAAPFLAPIAYLDDSDTTDVSAVFTASAIYSITGVLRDVGHVPTPNMLAFVAFSLLFLSRGKLVCSK